ncbi:hypothetical protein M3Y94_00091200 [Aphelenchoides besseyi]|nr:hypothetical protein M3Y94_00091200 [Aphelenchoides besseyi]KAI6237694.1 hypothetical protein M3Y95_00292200 [Aphelenchoides besseyi]
MENLWAAPLVQTATAIDRMAQLLDPELTIEQLGPYVYTNMEDCRQHCTDLLYTCTAHTESDGQLCTMDTTILVLVIVAAVFTGFLIPIICIIICMCTRFCGLFSDNAEAQGLIHSDLRHDWESYPSDGPQMFYNNQNAESTQLSQSYGLVYPHLGEVNECEEEKRIEVDEPEEPKETIVSSTDM